MCNSFPGESHSSTLSLVLSLMIQTYFQLKTREKIYMILRKIRIFNLALQRSTCFIAKKKLGCNLAVFLKGFILKHSLWGFPLYLSPVTVKSLE